MKKTAKILSYAATAALAAYASFAILSTLMPSQAGYGAAAQKVGEIETLLSEYYVDEYDDEALADAAAEAALDAVGDRWAYYVPASEMKAYTENSENAYCGVGIVIGEKAEQGYVVSQVTANSPAERAGVAVNDILCAVSGENVTAFGKSEIQSKVRGEAGTEISLGFFRSGQVYQVTLTREKIVSEVVLFKMMGDNIGYVRITNFLEHSAEQMKAAVEKLIASGAAGFIFDVRLNPGGEREELVAALDYLLPEGKIFSGVNYDGSTNDDLSDASCISLPMVVLMDEDTYSAAEFFAAALREYEWVELVGQKTLGKGNYQYTFPLSDGSAVAFSIGRYYTPQGKSLSDTGLTPDYEALLTDEQRALLYNNILPEDQDAQLQMALTVLRKKIS